MPKRSLFLSFLLFAAAANAQQSDILLFDENTQPGPGYYDASFGFKTPPSTLLLAGSTADKLTIDATHAYSGTQCGLLQWSSAAGGDFRMFIASPGWKTLDASALDSLLFFVNGPAQISAAALPKIGLEDASNRSSTQLSWSAYMSAGVDADSTTWQRVSIPLKDFTPTGGFTITTLKDVNFAQDAADGVRHTLWIDYIRLIHRSSLADTTLPPAPLKPVAFAGDRSVVIHWERSIVNGLAGYTVYRSTSRGGPYEKISGASGAAPGFTDFSATNGTPYWYYARTVNAAATEGLSSDTISAFPAAFSSDDAFLDYLERCAFSFFWYEANPANGMVKDRSAANSVASIAAIGFGLSSICAANERGWIGRQDARDRTLVTLSSLWHGQQGTGNSGIIGYRGWFYHWLDMKNATRASGSELSSIDTGLLLAGILDARQYFAGTDSSEGAIRSLADSILDRVDWNWMRNGGYAVTMGWYPAENGAGEHFINSEWRGYNEGMILYVLGMGAKQPLPGSLWSTWTSTYVLQTQYEYTFVVFPPLFGHQYSHCWIDFRSIADSYMKGLSSTYALNTRRATLAQRAYCIANPGGFPGYGANLWGLTACDGPGFAPYAGYSARGAPPASNDDGTIAPTAPAGSLPFTPTESIAALRNMYDSYRPSIWCSYGFRDAFNLKANWWDPDVIGIDEGPIVMMAENLRTGSIWNRFMSAPEVQRGLQAAGFTTVTGVSGSSQVPARLTISQNYPNPFNPSTSIEFEIPGTTAVKLKVFDVLGRVVAVLVDATLQGGRHSISWNAASMSSGVYYYRLETPGKVLTRQCLLLR